LSAGVIGSSFQDRSTLAAILGHLRTKKFPEIGASSPFDPANGNKILKILGK
jgi:hypothetical protein